MAHIKYNLRCHGDNLWPGLIHQFLRSSLLLDSIPKNDFLGMMANYELCVGDHNVSKSL